MLDRFFLEYGLSVAKVGALGMSPGPILPAGGGRRERDVKVKKES